MMGGRRVLRSRLGRARRLMLGLMLGRGPSELKLPEGGLNLRTADAGPGTRTAATGGAAPFEYHMKTIADFQMLNSEGTAINDVLAKGWELASWQVLSHPAGTTYHILFRRPKP